MLGGCVGARGLPETRWKCQKDGLQGDPETEWDQLRNRAKDRKRRGRL